MSTTPPLTEEIPSRHWADHAADELIRLKPHQTHFVCASGISPSGMVHIGNFREVITVDLVVRALRERGKQVRFLYSWDDYDAFRKVPANLPDPKGLESHLRRPISEVPDPFGTAPSYAAHFEKQFESQLVPMGIEPDYLYQNEAYRSCRYADGIQKALVNQDKIVAILNESRTQDLPEDWWCISVYCKHCGKDASKILGYEPPFAVQYRCKICKKDETVHFDKEPGVKLLWRVDWPMRWAFEKVDFEPGGKDHSSQGGSYDTGKRIAKEVWEQEPPYYVQYDFVLAKGLGAKLSSSSGQLITLGEALEIYEPAVIRWIFASRKPNLDFTIAFDLDVMRTYDDFDRCERFAYSVEDADDKKVSYEKRIYQLSCPQAPSDLSQLPAQFGFRHLCNLLQLNEGNLEKTQALYEATIKTPQDLERFRSRAQRAWRWISDFAPEDFKFRLRAADAAVEKTAYTQAVQALAQLLTQPETAQMEEAVLANAIYEVMKSNGLDAKRFFPEVYRILIGKASGPKLASFLLAMGPARGAALLRNAL